MTRQPAQWYGKDPRMLWCSVEKKAWIFEIFPSISWRWVDPTCKVSDPNSGCLACKGDRVLQVPSMPSLASLLSSQQVNISMEPFLKSRITPTFTGRLQVPHSILLWVCGSCLWVLEEYLTYWIRQTWKFYVSDCVTFLCTPWAARRFGWLKTCMLLDRAVDILLLMEEIPNNHLGCMKPCKKWDISDI